MELTVTEPFLGYKRGDVIVDPAVVADIRNSEHAHHVVAVPDGTHAAAEEPVPAPVPVAPAAPKPARRKDD